MTIFKLTLIQLKISLGLSAMRWNIKHDLKKFLGSAGIISLVLFSLGPMFFFYIRMLQGAYQVTAELGQPEVVLAAGLMISSMLVLFFGLTMVLSVFFFSRDLSILVPLPLQPGTIIGSKFLVIIVYEYLTVAPFLIPAIWVFGSGSGAGFLYWIIALFVFLLTPIIPLGLAALFTLLLMGITNLSRKRDTLRIVGMGIFLLLIFMLNYLFTGIPEGEELAYIEEMMQKSEGLLMQMTRIFPPALLAVRALSAAGTTKITWLAYFLLVNVIGMAVVYLGGQKLFYRGLIGGTEISKGKSLSEERLTKKLNSSSSPAMAIAIREIKYLLRTPIYLFNSLAILVVAPVILVIPLISGGALTNMIDALRDEIPRLVQVFSLAGFIALMALFTPAASSSFSREGRQFWISQVIPVSAKEQVNGKIIYSYLVSALSIPLVLMVSLVILPLDPIELLLVIIIGLLASLPVIVVSLLIDLLRPYLNWDNPQKAIKQNINVLLAMLAGGVIYALIFLAGWLAYQGLDSNLAVYLAVTAVSLVTGAALYYLLIKIAPNRYRGIEV
ncbi:MAG: putative ABC transporter permease subunit [Bacillota bacterium]